jgi:hypothetical protein
MKTVLKKTIKLETKRHNFDNEFAYIELWCNNKLKDCYFAEKEFLYPDGTIKSGGKRFFYCPSEYDIDKKIKKVNYEKFSDFHKLYYYDQSGEIINIRGI